jgi:hypothetical protein
LCKKQIKVYIVFIYNRNKEGAKIFCGAVVVVVWWRCGAVVRCGGGVVVVVVYKSQKKVGIKKWF